MIPHTRKNNKKKTTTKKKNTKLHSYELFSMLLKNILLNGPTAITIILEMASVGGQLAV